MLKLLNVCKKFKSGDSLVLNNINLNIHKGEIVGLIGKNGAGKTTLMKLITKSKRLSSGQIFIDDVDISTQDNVLKDVGIMIDTVYYSHLSAEKNLLYFLKINNQIQYIDNIDYILNLVGLSHTKNKKVKDFSFGMKQRLCLAMCLLTEPKLAIMDEPFVGLDPNGVKSLIDALKSWVQNKNISILISSHQLNELEEVCDRFVILKDGELKQVDIDDNVELRIVLNKEVDLEDANFYMKNFSIINKIDKNIIYIKNNTVDYNELLHKILEKYALVKLESTKSDLYNVYNQYENQGDN